MSKAQGSRSLTKLCCQWKGSRGGRCRNHIATKLGLCVKHVKEA